MSFPPSLVGWLLLFGTGACAAVAAEAGSGGIAEVSAATLSNPWRAVGLGCAAALAVGLSVLGAGYAVARVGSAALGAATERPELLIRSLLFVALAEGLAVLGFAIGMMILQKI
ncbi:MAG: hypothetical protein IT581_22300 [Verrucomicrobiales bacterium]|nr:hypothetical protein [Verrucomicrobiales bacterium]